MQNHEKRFWCCIQTIGTQRFSQPISSAGDTMSYHPFIQKSWFDVIFFSLFVAFLWGSIIVPGFRL